MLFYVQKSEGLRRGAGRTYACLPCAALWACCLGSPAPVWAQAEAASPPSSTKAAPVPDTASPGAITEKMRRDDPRLTARVSAVLPHATVRELTNALGAATNVVVRVREGAHAPRDVDTRFASGDTVVCAFLPALPLSDALNAVVALLSFDKARWTWERVKEADGKYAYELTPPPARLSAYALRVRTEIQTEFETRALQAVAATGDAPAKPDDASSGFYDYSKDQAERKKVCLDVFRQALTLEERLAVLRGEVRVAMAEPSSPLWATIKKVGGSRAEHVFSSFAVTNEIINSRPAPTVAPGSVAVSFRSTSFEMYWLCPELTASATFAPNPLIACDENAWVERLNRSWTETAGRERRNLPAPEAQERVLKGVVAPLPVFESKNADSKTPDAVVDAEELTLWRLSQGANLPVLALLPPRHESVLGRSEQGIALVTGIVKKPPREITLYVMRKDEFGKERRVPVHDKDGGTTISSGSSFAENHPIQKTLDGKTVAVVLDGLQQWPTSLRRKWSGSPDNPVLLLRDPVAPFRTDGGNWTLPRPRR